MIPFRKENYLPIFRGIFFDLKRKTPDKFQRFKKKLLRAKIEISGC